MALNCFETCPILSNIHSIFDNSDNINGLSLMPQTLVFENQRVKMIKDCPGPELKTELVETGFFRKRTVERIRRVCCYSVSAPKPVIT